MGFADRDSAVALNYPQEADMNDAVISFVATFFAIFFPVFLAVFLAVLLSSKEWREAQEKARERRMAEHRLNARLLRFNV